MQDIEIITQEDGFTVLVHSAHLSFWLDKCCGWTRQLAEDTADILSRFDARTCSLDYKLECEQLEDENDQLADTVADLRAELAECRGMKEIN